MAVPLSEGVPNGTSAPVGGESTTELYADDADDVGMSPPRHASCAARPGAEDAVPA
jgi:hypothetical protein